MEWSIIQRVPHPLQDTLELGNSYDYNNAKPLCIDANNIRSGVNWISMGACSYSDC